MDSDIHSDVHPDFCKVYRSGADRYQELVGAEDVDGNLISTLAEVFDAHDLTAPSVVEIGAGTGRVTRLLGELGCSVAATEPAGAMLEVAARLNTGTDALLARADAAALPFGEERFDAAVAGWVFAHQREWSPDSWREVVTGFVAEASRVVRRGGPIVLIETLGTGHETPDPPADLAEYYEWLETAMGFERRWIRTDYRFASVDEAAAVTGDFFGPGFAETVRMNGWSRIPECTGVWSRRT